MSELLKFLKEKFCEENRNELVFVIPSIDASFYAYSIEHQKFCYFFFDHKAVNVDLNSIDLWMIDIHTLEYAKFPIKLDIYAQMPNTQYRLEFASQYVNTFFDLENKETLLM